MGSNEDKSRKATHAYGRLSDEIVSSHPDTSYQIVDGLRAREATKYVGGLLIS